MRSPAKHRILLILRIWIEKKSHNPNKLSYVFEKKNLSKWTRFWKDFNSQVFRSQNQIKLLGFFLSEFLESHGI
jgi:hypothetical protein